MSLSKFARLSVATDSEDDDDILQLFLSKRQRKKFRGVGAGARKKLKFSSVSFKPKTAVISSSESSNSTTEDEEVPRKKKEIPVIDLCSSSNSSSNCSSDSENVNFSPVKAKSEMTLTDKIRGLFPDMCENDFHDPDMHSLPILARQPSGLTVTQLFNLMVGTIPEEKICKHKPTSVTYSSVFVVDLSHISKIEDLKADDNGAWQHGGKPRRMYNLEFDDTRSEVLSANLVERQSNCTFTLVRIYHRHKATPEFQRRIAYTLDSSDQVVKYAVVQSLFEDGIEIPVILPPHGNCKNKSTPYCRTQKSTLERIKTQKGKPKDVVRSLHDEAGGSLGAFSASELPRNRQQVYNARQQPAVSSDARRVDPFFDLIKQCKEDLLPHGRRFVRCVSVDTSPSCVLATDKQLSDLQRFCTRPGNFCVLGIDPTFNLGKFYVTITTYTYMHLENKRTHISPTFFGPVFVHTEKTFEAYYHFFVTLLKLEPKLSGIRAAGTDGEGALIKALRTAFSEDLILLRCFVHMKDNLRHRLTEMHIPEKFREDILKDIFGMQQGEVYTKGLLDASDPEDFDRRLCCLKDKWDDIEMSACPHQTPRFHEWLLKNEAESVKSLMISSAREAAGLGCPPAKYTTNRNESLNKVAKAQANYSRLSWVQLNDTMYQLISDLHKEVERAVYKMGEYQLRGSYRHLEVDSGRWFKMTLEQRAKHLQKVFGFSSIAFECPDEHSNTASKSSSSRICLSVEPERSGIVSVSPEALSHMWKKAERLLNSPNSVCDAPGMVDAKCVASDSGDKPHIVTKSKRGLISCDESCMGWKSQRICAHTLAAAESMGCLEDFIRMFTKSKHQPSFTSVVTHNVPKGVGSKPGKPKRKGPSISKKSDIVTYVDPYSPQMESLPAQMESGPTEQPLYSQEVLPHSSAPLISSNHIFQLNLQPTLAKSSPSVYTSTVPPGQFSTGGSPTVVNAGPFQVKLLTPAIRVCAGCRGGYDREGGNSPSNVILVRKEQHLYYNVVTGRQQASCMMNVHYHANLSCPRVRCVSFNPAKIEIPQEVLAKLSPEQWFFLIQTFGIN